MPRLLAVLGALTALAAMTPAVAARGVDAPRQPSATTTTVLSPPPAPPTPELPEPPDVPDPPALPSPSAGATPNLAAVQVKLVELAALTAPVAMAFRKGDQRPYVAEKGGAVRALDGRSALDLRGQLAAAGDEQGLLGLVFSPDGKHMYVDYTDTANAIRVVEYAFVNGAAVLRTRRDVLTITHPSPIHNGGHLAFGPDRMLWISTGDGSAVAGDPDDNAQSLASLLGKILRIDPRPSGGRPYSVPPTNPFVRTRGARPEIWAFGLRNPWRFSFDATTRDLWIANVGQDHWESIYYQLGASPGGQNYGWSRVEGSHPYYGAKPANTVDPIYEYPHQGGACAVIGGYVYRGSKIAGLGGAYLFGDLCTGAITAVEQTAGRLGAVRRLPITVPVPTSFGQDPTGELYVLSLAGAIFRLEPAT